MCTGDGWASDIARPIFAGADEPDEMKRIHQGLDAATALFFVSFVVLVAWTLLQVVVAVLLGSLSVPSATPSALLLCIWMCVCVVDVYLACLAAGKMVNC